jgi:hypothetical protein
MFQALAEYEQSEGTKKKVSKSGAYLPLFETIFGPKGPRLPHNLSLGA